MQLMLRRVVLILFFGLVFLCCFLGNVRSGDAEALLALKRFLDPSNGVLQWGDKMGGEFCQWQGVKECLSGEGGEKRVSKLVVENLSLNGVLDEKSLNQLNQLRVLSFKSNSISGKIPSFYGLANLKSLYLNNNNFSGEFPASLSELHRLKTIVLSGNILSGEIPKSLIDLPRLYMLYLEDNDFSGKVPPFKQPSLRFLNLSNNILEGDVPVTIALSKFNDSSFGGNMGLCGEVVHRKCGNNPSISSPSYPFNAGDSKPSGKNGRKKMILIIVLSVVGGFLVLSALVVLFLFGRSRQKRVEGGGGVDRGKGVESGERGVGGRGCGGGGDDEGGDGGKQGGFSWDQGVGGGGDRLGALVFLGPGDEQMTYNLEDLLKASAETLGRGIMGSTYKAVMESGYIVTVKRLKDARYPRLEEFRRHVEILGRLRHPNLVPLRAYFQDCVRDSHRSSVSLHGLGVDEDRTSLDNGSSSGCSYSILTSDDVLPIETARARFMDIVVDHFINAHVVPVSEFESDFSAESMQDKLSKRQSREIQYEGDAQYVLPLMYIANMYETLANEVNKRLCSLNGLREKTIAVALEAAGGLYRKLSKKFPRKGVYTFKRRELATSLETRSRFPELVIQEEKRVRFVVVNGLEIVENPTNIHIDDAEWFKRLTGRNEVAISARDYKFYAPRHKYRRVASAPVPSISGLQHALQSPLKHLQPFPHQALFHSLPQTHEHHIDQNLSELHFVHNHQCGPSSHLPDIAQDQQSANIPQHMTCLPQLSHMGRRIHLLPHTPAKFCDECGAPYLRDTSKFCSECGTKRLGT